MRRELESASSGATLRSVIEAIGPKGIRQWLRESPGVALRIGKTAPAVTPIAGSPGRFAVEGTSIEIAVKLSYSRELSSVVQSVTLTNTGKEESVPIERIDAFSVPLEVRVHDGIRAMSIGGGTTSGYYPPPAYREEQVTFGKPLTYEDPEATFVRWWVAQRFFRVASDEGSLSSKSQWPVMTTGWSTPDGFVGLWAAMAWSGRYEMELGCETDWRFYLRGGPKVNNMVLDPGESVRLPDVHIGVYGGRDATIEDGANGVRRQLAEVIAPDVQRRRPWPYAAYHHWFGIEHNITEEIAREQIDTAAELGLEFVEIDDGWFGDAAEDFTNRVGTWELVDSNKFPHGLEPVAEHARNKGIGFGLWFEPERGRKGSDWVTAHPEFYWPPEKGVNYHLNLTRPEVQDALIEMLSSWVVRLDIRWLRWDYNHGSPNQYWDAADPTGKVQFAYFEGLYRVMDTLLERHPDLMIDNCAGGGRRNDFGTFTRAGSMVISDHAEDPHICRIMQTGAARFIPGNWANSSIYCSIRDPDEYVDHLALTSRMAGAISLSGYISHWSAAQKKKVKRYLDGFKSYRHLLMKDFHRITPYPRTPDDWDVVEFLDPSVGEAVVLAYRVEGASELLAKPTRLNPKATYRIVDPFTGTEKGKRKGSDLMKRGLRLELSLHDAAVLHLIPT